ncbi:MAG: RraA family protein [Pirellulaceae bacterium]|jgi:regulator of RNase E activity RraA|nr:RraA family protein [Pirellulaceae bacterium]MDP7303435.1 RraA family protein [Pirellulaceae bacterium]HJN11738.1 RraA family protein [Pirellulaceae bacterium]
MTITQATLDKLAKYDTPTICNVIELFDIRPRNVGYMDGRVKCDFPELSPMVGFAATAQFRSDAPPSGGDAYGSIQRQLEQFAELPGPAVVVFQDADDPAVAAVFGEVMCSTYKAFGSAGLVTNGGGRDLEQVRELKFPVFTGNTICSHAYCHMLHLGLPVRVGGLMVNQADLLHGDANGVTSIPPHLASEIADIGEEFLSAEAIMLDYVKAPGDKSVAKFNELREEFQTVVGKLKARVQQ